MKRSIFAQHGGVTKFTFCYAIPRVVWWRIKPPWTLRSLILLLLRVIPLKRNKGTENSNLTERFDSVVAFLRTMWYSQCNAGRERNAGQGRTQLNLRIQRRQRRGCGQSEKQHLTLVLELYKYCSSLLLCSWKSRWSDPSDSASMLRSLKGRRKNNVSYNSYY